MSAARKYRERAVERAKSALILGESRINFSFMQREYHTVLLGPLKAQTFGLSLSPRVFILLYFFLLFSNLLYPTLLYFTLLYPPPISLLCSIFDMPITI